MSRARDIAAYVATGVTASEFDALDGITVNATSMNSTVNQVTDGATDFNVDTNTLVVDKSENRVGIGTATPSTTLQVNGTATATTFVGALTGSASGNAGTVTNGVYTNSDTTLGAGVDISTSTTGKIKQKGAFMQSSFHQSLVLGY